MTRYKLTIFATAMVVACGGGNRGATDSAATAATAAAPGETPVGASTGPQPAPIIGQTVEVKMLQDSQGNYRFEPADVTIKSGDGVKFVMVSGGTAHSCERCASISRLHPPPVSLQKPVWSPGSRSPTVTRSHRP